MYADRLNVPCTLWTVGAVAGVGWTPLCNRIKSKSNNDPINMSLGVVPFKRFALSRGNGEEPTQNNATQQ
jgi:hypothetical protein